MDSLRRRIDLKNVFLIGHSFGGATCLEVRTGFNVVTTMYTLRSVETHLSTRTGGENLIKLSPDRLPMRLCVPQVLLAGEDAASRQSRFRGVVLLDAWYMPLDHATLHK